MNKRQLGSDYEEKACEYLRENGYSILDINFRNRIGEIDIIARDDAHEDKPICFVEVKFRSKEGYGMPSEAVDYKKRKTIVKVAKYYLASQKLDEWTACRFDVVAMEPQKIILYKNAFDASAK